MTIERHVWPRLYKIHQLLLQKCYPSRQQLAERLEVSSRTIQRDIDMLRDSLGASIEYDKSRGGYYYSRDTFPLLPFNLNSQEKLALGMALAFSGQIGDPIVRDAMLSSMEKISCLLPDELSIDTDDWNEIISSAQESFQTGNLREQFLSLVSAIEQRCVVEIVYDSFSSQITDGRKINPYHLRKSRGIWYVIAYCHNRNSMRMFALQRVRSLQVTNERFIRDEFDVEHYMRDSLFEERGDRVYEITLRFSARQAPYIRERIWHASQKVYDQPNGEIVMHFQASGLNSIKRWIMQYGSEVEVVGPQELREEIKFEIKKMMEKYGG
ncbi:helix-turn-helix transcriptional regulator [Effusibacillus consociatus]|uniref:Helix-turn-helix transcriptional regulator n=1 Tax=Effusibacillus consociatus TaxID=1117041 RepID=A0ABV9Q6Q3_9BACL